MVHADFFSSLLFCIGAYGVLTRRNAIVVLMCIEIMLNAANVNLVAFSSYHSVLHGVVDPSGHAFALFSIAIAAAEVAVGLAILLTVYRQYRTIEVDKLNILRW